MARRQRQRTIPHKARQPKQVKKQLEVADVLIGVPCQDQCSSFFAYDLARLTAFSGVSIPNCSLRLLFSQGTLIGPQREDVVRAALGLGTTHIMWLDSDMRFPKEALQGLLAHKKDIVGANYTKRVPPHVPTAYANGSVLYTHEDSEGLVSVDHVGMGVMLTRTDVFKKIGMPRFPIEYIPEKDRYVGEDVAFMQKVKLAGYEIWVDQDLSQYVQHTGKMDFTNLHALDSKELMTRVTMAGLEKERETGEEE